MTLSTFAIYQDKEHSRKQSCMAEPGMPIKKIKMSNLSYRANLRLPSPSHHNLDTIQLYFVACMSTAHIVLLVSQVYYLKYWHIL